MPGQNQENSIIGWCLRNPENLHARYSDELSDEHVQLILDGQLDEFFHSRPQGVRCSRGVSRILGCLGGAVRRCVRI